MASRIWGIAVNGIALQQLYPLNAPFRVHLRRNIRFKVFLRGNFLQVVILPSIDALTK